MRFDQKTIGPYRIYTGAVEGRHGDGYTAALIVEQRPGTACQPTREVLRDENLACGHRWASADEALAYAMQRARALIRQLSPAEACCGADV